MTAAAYHLLSLSAAAAVLTGHRPPLRSSPPKYPCDVATGANCCCDAGAFSQQGLIKGCVTVCSASNGCVNRTTAPYANSGCVK